MNLILNFYEIKNFHLNLHYKNTNYKIDFNYLNN